MSESGWTPIDVRIERFGREPESYFALFNLTNPLALWEIAIGRVSSHVGADASGFGMSAWAYKLLAGVAANGVSQRYLDEMTLELNRRTVAPDAVPRLDCVYLLPDLATAQRAVGRWGWTHLTISEVQFWPTKETSVDSEWITTRLGSGTTDWFSAYWSGAACNQQPITELLANGVGLVIDNELRSTAYHRVLKEFPGAARILAASAAGFWCGYDTVGQVKYGAVQSSEGLQVGAYLYMADFESTDTFDREAVNRQCEEDGVSFGPGDDFDEEADLVIPDLRPWAFTLNIPGIAEPLASVPHDGQ